MDEEQEHYNLPANEIYDMMIVYKAPTDKDIDLDVT
jgi:hypothetical protein